MSKAQNLKSAEVTNTPSNVIANAARFNKQFLDSQLGGPLPDSEPNVGHY